MCVIRMHSAPKSLLERCDKVDDHYNVFIFRLKIYRSNLGTKTKQLTNLKDRVKSLQTDSSNTDTALATLEEALSEKVMSSHEKLYVLLLWVKSVQKMSFWVGLTAVPKPVSLVGEAGGPVLVGWAGSGCQGWTDAGLGGAGVMSLECSWRKWPRAWGDFPLVNEMSGCSLKELKGIGHLT